MAYYETYQWAWIVYLMASVGMYYVVTKFTKYWRNDDFKHYLRMLAAVILFTPATHSLEGIDALAPAYIVMFAELLTNGVLAALKGLIPLLLALLLGTVALTIQAFINRKVAQYKNK